MSATSPPKLRIAVLGGEDPEALATIVAGLPATTGWTFVVAHPPAPDLVASLQAVSSLPVTEVAAGQTELAPDRIYVVPSTADAALHRNALSVRTDGHPEAPLDRLLRSVADARGRDCAAVILGGTGTDGVLGLGRIKEVGGLTLVQNGTHELTPRQRAVLASGLVDIALPVEQIAGRLTALATLVGPRPPEDLDEASLDDQADPEVLRDIIALLRVRTGHDFSAYKRATLYRRVARRMLVCQTMTMPGYLRYLRDHPPELSHLLRDFLISVTNFFRDKEAFDALATTALPRLLANKTAADQVRVWSAGCATGEEAYSLAILLVEALANRRERPQIQIFATDIDDSALVTARSGIYPESIALDVSTERLERFFTRDGPAHYRVNKEIRELVLFSPHNLLRDPPFSRLDLVACRNLLIYLDRSAQDRVLTTFHFALRPEGCLFLGTSESAEGSTLFSTLDPKHRLFLRRPAPAPLNLDTMSHSGRWPVPPPPPVPTAPNDRLLVPAELHYRALERYAPPSVLVDKDLTILHISEHAGRFPQMPGGEPSRDLLRCILPALRIDLRTAIHDARQSPRRLDTRQITFEQDGHPRAIELRVRAVDAGERNEDALLVMFEELEPELRTGAELPGRTASLEPIVHDLEEELRRTRDTLRTTVEQYETTVEELKASNEELQAINEELRSATEELETGKEELQSVNEELTTLNQELKVKVDEVTAANSDLQNLMSSTDIGVLFLDRNLNIKRFTPRSQELFNVIATDIGRPFAHVTHQLTTDELPALARSVLETLRGVERDVWSTAQRRYLLRILPYRSLDDRIDGAVLTFIEVTDLRAAIDARRLSDAARETSEHRLRIALRQSPLVVLAIDANLVVEWGYILGEELAPASIRVADLFARGHGERFAQVAGEVRATRTPQRLEADLMIRGTQTSYELRVEADGDLVTAVGLDISASKRAQAELRAADRRKDEFLATLSHELRNPLTPLKVALDVTRLSTDKQQLEQSRQIMERQVAQLSQLVDELLDLSRITQGKLQLDRVTVDPVVVIEHAVETTRPLFDQHHHKLVLHVPSTSARVIGDQQRLVQVVVNLLTNAVKYTPDGGIVELGLERDDRRHVVAIRVRDNGVGIAPDLLPHVFEIFVQSRDALGRAQGGLGIGLHLVKQLVELHGGTVTATSEGAGRGSELRVELPLAG